MSNSPTYDKKGNPTNLEAAANDTLEWLRFWQKYQDLYLIGKKTGGNYRLKVFQRTPDSRRMMAQNARRLKRAIKALEGFLAEKEAGDAPQ